MNKKIFGATLLLSLLIGATSFAQTPAGSCCNQNAATCHMAQAKDRKQMHGNPFEGLNLTEKQQAEIKAMREECMKQTKAEAQAKREANIKARQERKAERLAKIKAILTPEQYVKFLENGGAQKCCEMGKGRHAGKHGMKGQRKADKKIADKAQTKKADKK